MPAIPEQPTLRRTTLNRTLDSSARPAVPYSSFEQRLAALSPDDMRAMLRSIFMDFYPEGVDADEARERFDEETCESAAETFWCMGFKPPLKTEQNTEEMRERIEAAFGTSDAFRLNHTADDGDDDFAAAFEHGQWFIQVTAPARDDVPTTYSVVDAEPGIDGFGFEEV